MSVLETIAIVSTIISVILTAKLHILCWPIGLISIVSLIGVYLQNHIYAQILLQLIFLVQSIIGWYNWGKKDELKVTSIDIKTLMSDIIFWTVIGIMFSIVNYLRNDDTNIVYSLLDGISAFIAILGSWYLIKKFIQAWMLFIFYNLFLGILLFFKGDYILGALNLLLLLISINGFTSWKKDLKQA